MPVIKFTYFWLRACMQVNKNILERRFCMNSRNIAVMFMKIFKSSKLPQPEYNNGKTFWGISLRNYNFLFEHQFTWLFWYIIRIRRKTFEVYMNANFCYKVRIYTFSQSWILLYEQLFYGSSEHYEIEN